MITRKMKGVYHIIYKDDKEFEDYFRREEEPIPKVVDWRDVTESMQWVRADDGGIHQVLKLRFIKEKKGTRITKMVQTAIGLFMTRPYRTKPTKPP